MIVVANNIQYYNEWSNLKTHAGKAKSLATLARRASFVGYFMVKHSSNINASPCIPIKYNTNVK